MHLYLDLCLVYALHNTSSYYFDVLNKSIAGKMDYGSFTKTKQKPLTAMMDICYLNHFYR